MKYEPRLHVVLYQPEIPHNTGAVGRTCVAIGAKLWLVRPLGFQLTDYYLRRSGLDYWDDLEWEAVDDWTDLCAKLTGGAWWYFTKFATRSYTTARFALGDVLVFGRETNGLPTELVQQNVDRALRIPIREAARSLNLSNSVAIAAFEAQRQWGEEVRVQGSGFREEEEEEKT